MEEYKRGRDCVSLPLSFVNFSLLFFQNVSENISFEGTFHYYYFKMLVKTLEKRRLFTIILIES